MARARADFPPAAAIRALADSEGRLALRVTPGARSESMKLGEGRLLISVRVKAEDGKANAEVLAVLGRALGIATSRLQLLRGATGRDKLVKVAG